MKSGIGGVLDVVSTRLPQPGLLAQIANLSSVEDNRQGRDGYGCDQIHQVVLLEQKDAGYEQNIIDDQRS